jgi:uncharacterized protein
LSLIEAVAKLGPAMRLSQGEGGIEKDLHAVDSAVDEIATGPLRRCLVTREVLPKTHLIRFVVGPDAVLVPDVAGRLPGRGLWVKAERATLAAAVAKRLFPKAAKRQVEVPPDLVERTGALLAQRCLDLLGLARGAGQAVAGFEKVRDWLETGRAGLLLGAADGAADGRRKLAQLAQGMPLLALFSSAELSAALGRDNVVHAALAKGGLAERLKAEADRLAGLRGTGLSRAE